jgi:hypothetical protein
LNIGYIVKVCLTIVSILSTAPRPLTEYEIIKEVRRSIGTRVQKTKKALKLLMKLRRVILAREVAKVRKYRTRYGYTTEKYTIRLYCSLDSYLKHQDKFSAQRLDTYMPKKDPLAS